MEEVIVLDFGSQYNQLITRRIRGLGVYSTLVDYDISIDEIKSRNIKGIILSGGPRSVYDSDAFKIDPKILDLGIPVLGICYGMQLISYMNNATVKPLDEGEYGGREITVLKEDSLLFKGLPKKEVVWMSHKDGVTTIPDGFELVAKSDSCPICSIENRSKNIYAVQFHPEVYDSVYGTDLIGNFIFNICKCEKSWNMDSFIDDKIKEIRETVKDKRVLLGVSGGVDSTVCAVLISKAIGNNLTCMFIDHGFMRKGEPEMVKEVFKQFNVNLVAVDASDLFIEGIKGVSDPEVKRKTIGRLFVETFDKESSKLGEFDFLGQGTLYTDVIESGTKTAQTIKSHHNVGGLPKNMKMKLIEPLNTLFKDEVRELGRRLGIPEECVNRQPFPGPGLSIRIIGDVTREKLNTIREADAILREEISKAGLNYKIWQYFAILTNNTTVGVMGDQRTYLKTVAIRCVNSIDGMSADWYKVPYDVLDTISRRIVNEIVGVNRVVFDITSKPPATIEWE